MAAKPIRKKARLRSLVAVAVVHLLIGFVLVTGLHVDIVRQAGEALNIIDVEEITQSETPESEVAPDLEEEGAAAPPDLDADAAPIVVPEPVIELPTRSEARAARERDDGFEDSQGAAEEAGPGSGAGGEGDGTGSGAGGDGSGGGTVAVPARRIAGEITPRDYPRSARNARAQGTVSANISIGPDGRVSRCVVARSSGNADLDETTCRLIRERFRYEPARNAAGEPVPDAAGREQRWWLGNDED